MKTFDNINILIVDDIEDNLLLLESLLDKPELTIHLASSGKKALEIMNDYEFALMLFDVQMPGMDGFQLAEITRQNDKTKYVPIIFITAMGNDTKHVFKGYSSGAVDYLSKPIEPVILQRKVDFFISLYEQKLELQQKKEELEKLNALLIEKNIHIENQNKLLEEKQHSLTLAYNMLELRNKDITDSIKYAKRIQQSIIPSGDELRKIFPESFVYFKPKDILSGDFFWLQPYPFNNPSNNKPLYIFAAVIDCTGHGVPGALLSLVGNNLLNRALKDYFLVNTDDILNEVNNELINILNQSSIIQINDGMEIGLIRFDTEEFSLTYSGARIPLYLIRNNQLIIVEPDKASIGYDDFKPVDFSFTKHLIHLEKGDTIFLFSDGFPDQFGGEERRKFSYKLFKEMLLSINHHDMQTQVKIISEKFLEWKGQVEQTDDVTIIGIRF